MGWWFRFEFRGSIPQVFYVGIEDLESARALASRHADKGTTEGARGKISEADVKAWGLSDGSISEALVFPK